MHTLKQIIEAIGNLTDSELEELHAWLLSRDDHLEMTEAFESRIRDSEHEMASGQRPRTR